MEKIQALLEFSDKIDAGINDMLDRARDLQAKDQDNKAAKRTFERTESGKDNWQGRLRDIQTALSEERKRLDSGKDPELDLFKTHEDLKELQKSVKNHISHSLNKAIKKAMETESGLQTAKGPAAARNLDKMFSAGTAAIEEIPADTEADDKLKEKLGAKEKNIDRRLGNLLETMKEHEDPGKHTEEADAPQARSADTMPNARLADAVEHFSKSDVNNKHAATNTDMNRALSQEEIDTLVAGGVLADTQTNSRLANAATHLSKSDARDEPSENKIDLSGAFSQEEIDILAAGGKLDTNATRTKPPKITPVSDLVKESGFRDDLIEAFERENTELKEENAVAQGDIYNAREIIKQQEEILKKQNDSIEARLEDIDVRDKIIDDSNDALHNLIGENERLRYELSALREKVSAEAESMPAVESLESPTEPSHEDPGTEATEEEAEMNPAIDQQQALLSLANVIGDFALNVKNVKGVDHSTFLLTKNFYDGGRYSWTERLNDIRDRINAGTEDGADLRRDLDILLQHINEHADRTVNPAIRAKNARAAAEAAAANPPTTPPAPVPEIAIIDNDTADRQAASITLNAASLNANVNSIISTLNGARTSATVRARSQTGERNRARIDAIKDAILRDISTAAGIDPTDPALTMEKLNRSQRRKFDEEFANRATDGGKLAIMPPRMLVEAYKKTTNDDLKTIIFGRMNELAKYAATAGNNFYNFADYTNAGAVAEGYLDMFDFMKSNRKGRLSAAETTTLNDARTKVQGYLDNWDARHGLDNVTPGKKNETLLNRRAADLKALLAGIQISGMPTSAQTLLNNLRLKYPDGNDRSSEDAASGKELIFGIAKSEVFNEALFRDINLGAASMKPLIEDKLKEVLWRMNVADKVSQGLLETPELFTNPAHMNKYIAELAATPKEMQDSVMREMLDVHRQESFNVIERTGARLNNNKADVLNTMYDRTLLKGVDGNTGIDEKSRFSDLTEKTYRNNFKKQIGASLLIAGGMGFAFNILRHVNFPIPGIGMAAVGAISTGLAIVNTKRHYDQWKLETGQKGFGKYLKDKKNWAHLGISLASVGAAITGIGAGAGIEGLSGISSILRGAAIGGVAAKGLAGGIARMPAAIEQAQRDGTSIPMAVMASLGHSVAAGAVPLAAGLAGGALAEGLVSGVNAINPGNTTFNKETVTIIKGEDQTIETMPATDTFSRTYSQTDIDHATMRIGSVNLEVNQDQFTRATNTIADYDAAQHPGNFRPDVWISPADSAVIIQNLGASTDLFSIEDREIGGWQPGSGSERVMLYKMLAAERLAPNHEFVVGDDSFKTGDLLAALRAGPLTPAQAQAVFQIQNSVSAEGHWLPNIPGLSNTDTWTNPAVKGVMSYYTTREAGIRFEEIKIDAEYETIPGEDVEDRKIEPAHVTSGFLDRLSLALPFVFPARKKMKEFKSGIKALLDMTNKVSGNVVGEFVKRR